MTTADSSELALLLTILEELPAGVWVARAPDGQLAYANRAFTQIMGAAAQPDARSGDYARNYRLHDRAGRPYPEERLPFARALAERRTVTVDDLVVERDDSARVHVRAFGKPLFDARGEISHVVVAFSDITSEVAAEQDSVAARERLRMAVHHAPIIVFATDRAGMISVSEGAGLRGLGFTSGELVGRSVYDVFRDNPAALDNTRRVLTGGETFTTVVEVGDTALESWMAPVRDESAEIRGMIGVCTDVTERLRLQRQVEQADRLAAVGRLAASVAHEINNPLAYLLQALQLAGEAVNEIEAAPGDAGPATARLRRLLADAVEGAERVRVITRDMKSFTRSDERPRRPLNLGDVLATAIKLVSKRIETRARIDMVVAAPVTVEADENRLVQIFVNLVLNAADALPPETAQANRIRISTRADGDAVVVEVADNGPGVPQAVRARIFEPFFTTKPVGEGTGLGLFVTRNLVEALGGAIAIAEAPGGGAVFSVRLPARHGGAPPPQPAAVAPDAHPRRAGAERRFRILIIDDEPQIAHLLSRSLERDHDVQSFTSGRAALDHLVSGATYDLIFCDLMMREVSGMKLYTELRRLAPGRERGVVFMTGGVFDPQVSAFLATVPNDCLDKPFDIRAEIARRLKSAAAPRG